MPVWCFRGRTPGRFNMDIYLYDMKILITESQINVLIEDLEKMDEQVLLGAGLGAQSMMSKATANPDDATDYLSAGLDTIPGLGNLASLGIDMVHAATYAYRYMKTNDERLKIEYGILGLITLISSIVPVGGNAVNIASRKGLKQFVRKTPEEVLRILQKYGLYNQKIWALQKTPWSFNVGLFIYKASQGEVSEFLPAIQYKLSKLINFTKKTQLIKPLTEFKNMVDDINANKEIYGKISQYV